MCKDTNVTSFWVAVMVNHESTLVGFKPTSVRTSLTTKPQHPSAAGSREVEEGGGVTSLCSLRIRVCVFASRSCFASTSVFPSDSCSSPVSNDRKSEIDSRSMKVKYSCIWSWQWGSRAPFVYRALSRQLSILPVSPHRLLWRGSCQKCCLTKRTSLIMMGMKSRYPSPVVCRTTAVTSSVLGRTNELRNSDRSDAVREVGKPLIYVVSLVT